jgi:UDP-N-acetylglucosamine--N-acetylmuramyl-(pentapeptide) pyrophosphoryl-undecaprenol N-acetylglucosamine transferase
MEKFFPEERIIVTGNPVRANIAHSKVGRGEALKFFSLDEGKKTVLAIGGSLGARSINEAIDKHLADLMNAGLQLIWQTGKLYTPQSTIPAGVWVSAFINQMEYAYAAADIVIARSGAMTVAELCVARKPVLFVPYPFAAEDHQTVNAMQLVNKNAAIMVRDSEAQEKAVSMIIGLAGDERKQSELKENIGQLAVIDADKRIAREILNSLGRG